MNKGAIGKRLSLLFLFITITILVSIRCNSGSDYYNYYLMYNTITDFYSSGSQILMSNYQFGYPLLCFFIKKITDNSNAIFFVVSILSMIAPAWLIRKYSPFPILSYAILTLGGYLLISTNILKQVLAMSIIMFAIDRLLKKKYFSFVVCTLIASTFHITSLVAFAVLPFIKLIKLRKSFIFGGGVISLIAGFFSSYLLTLIIRIPLFSRYQRYFSEQSSIGKEDYKLMINAIFLAMTLGLIIIIILKFFNHYQIDYMEIFFFKLIIIAFFIAVFSINFFYVLRISFYFSQFLIIFIPIILNDVKDRIKLKKYWTMIFIGLIFFSIIFCIVSGENNYYNYSTIFDDIPMSVQDFVTFRNK
jgi:hypothetical protein